MMQHLQKFSSTMSDISATRKDLENTLFKLEGKLSKQMSVTRSYKHPNKLVRLGMFIMLYSVLILIGLYFCGSSIFDLEKANTSKMFLVNVRGDITTIRHIYRKLKIFFHIATRDNVTEDDLATVTAMLADIYTYHHGYPPANKTIQSVLTLDGQTAFKHTDTVFVFDQFFFIINQLADELITKLTSDVDAQNEDPLVRVSNVLRASALLHRCYYMLVLACRFDAFDMDRIMTYLNHVVGHLKSLFLRDFVKNTTLVLDAINEFKKNERKIELSLLQSNTSCIQVVETILSINTSYDTLDFGYNTIIEQIQSREERVSKARSHLLLLSLLILFTIIIIVVYVFIYKFKIEEVEDLKYCDNLLDEEITVENDFFQSTLADAIPKQLFGYVDIQYDDKPQFRRNNHSTDLVDDVFQRLSVHTRDSFARRRVTTSSITQHQKIRMAKISAFTKPPRISMRSTPPIEPYYQEVTVMMIDIVYFNRLLHYLTANEAVNVVTYLTKLIDDRASYYDVFVASKGTSSYTVISGFTAEQRFYHASQIANMALDINVSCSDLEIDKVPDSKLRLRIGIHTDSTCATVLSNPRAEFRIYGSILKTVKTLQKTSAPNKIQISDNTYALLCRDRVYNTMKRGFIDLKNGKKICTHWLLGKNVSVVSIAADFARRRSTIINPIELEQTPLYEFDVEEGMTPVWKHAHLFKPDDMDGMPHCSFGAGSSNSRRHRYHNNVLVEETEV